MTQTSPDGLSRITGTDAGGHTHASGRTLMLALTLTLGYAAVEALAGWWSGSLALVSDAGHMVSDSASLGLAALAAWAMRYPPSTRHSYGLGRAEIVAAFVNAAFMLAVLVWITVSAAQRLIEPQAVNGRAVVAVALVGLLINAAVALILARGEKSMNTRGALLHVMGDLLGSIAALISGAVIATTGWVPIDPLLSFLICGLILFSSLRLLRDALHALMEGVPFHLSLDEIGRAMAGINGVRSVHDLHVWTLSSDRVALSAHVVLVTMDHWRAVLAGLRELLQARFGIEHVTLQPETADQVVQPLLRRHEPYQSG